MNGRRSVQYLQPLFAQGPRCRPRVACRAASTSTLHSSSASALNTPTPTPSTRQPGNQPTVWKHKTPLNNTLLPSRLRNYNLRLSTLAKGGKSALALHLCAEMKRAGVEPDIDTYNHLLAALATGGLHMEAWATYKDMIAMGIPPDITTFNNLMHACRYRPGPSLHYIFEKIKERGIMPDGTFFNIFVRRLLAGRNLEMALDLVVEMDRLAIHPPVMATGMIVAALSDTGYAKLAIQIAEAFESHSLRRLEGHVWMKLLDASSRAIYAEGIQSCWTKVTDDYNLELDEGLCLQILLAAGRLGTPNLAASVIRHLEAHSIAIRDEHLEPLLESFARNGQFKEAFQVLELMVSSNLPLHPHATRPMVQVIQHDPDSIDNAWEALNELQSEGTKINIEAVNALIEATAFHADLPRAVGIYKAIPNELGLQPNVDTFNHLLSICVRSSHSELGLKLYGDMTASVPSIAPSRETYMHMIKLSLAQPVYEDAFFYLEEMKGKGMVPSVDVYEEIVMKLVTVGDTRYQLALKEMEQTGYKVTRRVQSALHANGIEVPMEGRSGSKSGRDEEQDVYYS